MTSQTLSVQDCTSMPGGDRCDATLPDNPQCTLNYHFGQLLGVDDFRVEQGFHLGRSRRHQRLLHGAGVVAGYPVSYKAADLELRVGPGYAVDALGRDLVLDAVQCVNLAKWWAARVQQKDSAFNDVLDRTDFTIDLDLVVCYTTCLSAPVPAIAEPCAGQASDLAYSRVCETVRLQLVRPPPAAPAASAFAEATSPLPSTRDALIDALAAQTIALPDDSDPADLCLTLARLRGVRIRQDGASYLVTMDQVDQHVRAVLLSTAALQSLLLPALDTPAPQAGPLLLDAGASANADQVTLPFDQPLAKASVLGGVFTVTQFDETTGWSLFNVIDASYVEAADKPPTVTLKLDRALTAGLLTRVSVNGSGPTPLLGAKLIPAGAARSDRDGRVLTITIQ